MAAEAQAVRELNFTRNGPNPLRSFRRLDLKLPRFLKALSPPEAPKVIKFEGSPEPQGQTRP
eukprot:1571186-Prymnesium_polylepis.2